MKKKIVPVVIAILLIILTIAIGIGTGIMEKYSYSDERADLFAYFEISKQGETAILLQDQLVEAKAIAENGTYYLPISFVKESMNERFYYDYNEDLLLYSLPKETVTVALTDTSYTKEENTVELGYPLVLRKDDAVYVAVDYIKVFTNFSYEAFEGPSRLQIRTQWGEKQVAYIKKNTQVRLKGGVKSEILFDVMVGDEVVVLETMENWSKVKTQNGIIGYVENKRLRDQQTISETPVTDVAEPEYTSLKKDYKINMVWNLVTNATANGNVDALLDKTKGINTISPTWFALCDNQGNLSSLADASYVSRMHERGIEVWAMVDNFTNKNVSTLEVISYTSKRTNFINNLMNQVKTYGIDGINLDFEQIPQEAADDYIQLIRELSIACRNQGIVFSIDNYVPTGYTEHYNRLEQGIVADYVVIMGYDEHWLGSDEPGSVASIDFVENGIADTLSVVPKEKVINALPFYTILWGIGEKVTSSAMGMKRAEEFLTEKGISAQWDDTTCQNYVTYTEEGVTYHMWLEDERSIETKLNVMKNYDIGGVSGWRLGFEKEVIWDKIAAFVQGE